MALSQGLALNRARVLPRTTEGLVSELADERPDHEPRSFVGQVVIAT